MIIDTNNASTHMILTNHNIDSLIGSDVQDWKQYSNFDSKKLIDINNKIDSLSKFIDLYEYDPTILQIVKKDIDKNNTIIKHQLKLPNNETKMEKTIINFKNLNIVFGVKASGKTILLKSINEELSKKSKCKFYQGNKKELEKTFDEKIKNIEKLDDLEKENLEKQKNFLTEIKDFKEIKSIEFLDFYNYYSNKKRKKCNLNEMVFVPTNVDVDDHKKKNFNKVIENTIEIINNLKIKKYYNTNEFSNEIEYFEKFIENFRNKFKKEFSNYWKSKLIKKINVKIEEILKLKKGEYSKPSNINLFEIAKKRKEIRNRILLLKNDRTQMHDVENLIVPIRNGNKLIIKKKIRIIEFLKDDDDKEQKEFLNSFSINKLIKKINKDFNKIAKEKNFFEVIENDLPKSEISKLMEKNKNDVWFHKTNLYFELFDKETKISSLCKEDFSSGEISLIMLSFVFLNQNEYDVFILDEPDTHLDYPTISNFLLKKIRNLRKLEKTIIIATHNSTLAINSIPTKYIQKEISFKNQKTKYVSNYGDIWSRKFTNEKPFEEILITNFEGGKKHFDFKKGIYGK